MALVFTKFESFLTAVKSITSKELEEAETLLRREGKEIELSELFVSDSQELVEVLPDGTLVRVNLYIPRKNIARNELNHLRTSDLNKYHIYKCAALEELFEKGRKNDFKVNTRDDGTFHYTFQSYGQLLKIEENQKLNICKWCLSIFLKRRSSDYAVENFNLKHFYDRNTSFFDFDTSALEKGEDAKINVYSQRWREISTRFKKRGNYTCEDCGWKPTVREHQRFVHSHHQNRDKTNNRRDNLKILCINCHSQVDEFHTQINKSDDYRAFMELR
jgi:hypothetical protein